jgi:hypothetical protein
MPRITFLAPPTAVATIQFKREITPEAFAPTRLTPETGRKTLRMNWLVVTASDSGSGIRACWTIQDRDSFCNAPLTGRP